MRYLTKSRFSVALECPTKLEFIDDNRYANADQGNELLAALADGGHQVGALAKCLFPDGIEVQAQGHDAQVVTTLDLLKSDEVTLFEAAIRVGSLFIRTDLLHKSGEVLELYEVKAKGFDPEDPQIVGKKGNLLSGMKPYLYDVAFQRYVLRKAFPDATIRCNLVMPNKLAICPESAVAQRLQLRKVGGNIEVEIDASLKGGEIARRLLSIVPVDEYLDEIEQQPLEMGGWSAPFDEGIEDLARRVNSQTHAPRLGSHCRSCQFRATLEDKMLGKLDGLKSCIGHSHNLSDEKLSHGTIFDLYAFRKTETLVAAGKLLLADLVSGDVNLAEKPEEITQSHRQWLQAEEARGALTQPVVKSEVLRQKISSFSYPLHFIDFETSRTALPFHAGCQPYEQILFQFSQHKITSDGFLSHATQHLFDRLETLPNFETVRALKQCLSDDNGTVFHWWDHERTVLNEVKLQLLALPENIVVDRPQLLLFIDELLGTERTPGRLFDLGRLVHRTTYLSGTGGSSSLKKVLPALLSSSQYLQNKYSKDNYGIDGEIPSLNFRERRWVTKDEFGRIVDPYSLLGRRVDDPDLAGLDQLEDDESVVANGGAAMVAFSLLQGDQLSGAAKEKLRSQLLRYCELDTLAMVMAWEGLNELVSAE